MPILQFPGEPEQAGEARRADSASIVKNIIQIELSSGTTKSPDEASDEWVVSDPESQESDLSPWYNNEW